MRLTAACIALAALVAACDRTQTAPEAETPAPATLVEVNVSDELPGLSAPATGVAFWEHPSLSFNGMMLTANADGLVAYNIEDGAEVSRAPGFSAEGLAVSYYGFGREAIGLAATLSADDEKLELFAIDNASRLFVPLAGGPAIRGAVRGLCFGRADGDADPTLFAVQRGGVQFFTLAAGAEGIEIVAAGRLETPDNLMSCAVGRDGALILADDKGDLFRLTDENSFDAPLARTGVDGDSDLAVHSTKLGEGDDQTVRDTIIVGHHKTGAVSVAGADDGALIGQAMLTETFDVDGVGAYYATGFTSANLGGLYRNGVIAFGLGLESPVIRIAPLAGVTNALGLDEGDPVSPRGAAPAEDDDALLFQTTFQPE